MGDALLNVLHDFSTPFLRYFSASIRLVVHGGALMVLYLQLTCRNSTRNIGSLHRAFETEWMARSVLDAGPCEPSSPARTG